MKTTLDIYSHVYKESEARAMQAVDIALFKDKKAAPQKPEQEPVSKQAQA